MRTDPQLHSESVISNDLCKLLKSQGHYCEAFAGSMMNKRGRPDRWFTSTHGSYWFEAKKENAALSKDQVDWHVAVNMRGVNALIFRYYTSGIAVFYLHPKTRSEVLLARPSWGCIKEDRLTLTLSRLLNKNHNRLYRENCTVLSLT